MKTRHSFALAVIASILLGAVAACGSSNQDRDIAIAVALTQTAAALEQPATPVPPTPVPNTPVPDTPLPPPPTATLGPTNTPGSAGCTNNFRFVADVTIPDKTVVAPGSAFTKIWRIKNSGTCTWTSSYRLTFAGGHQMSAPGAVAVSGNVAPGAEYDFSVNMTAPTAGGEYQGRWNLVDGGGATLGQIYVWIVVPSTPTPTSQPAATPAGSVYFWAERASLKAGECTTLRWKVENVRAVFFEGGGVSGNGSEKVCPTQTKTYELRIDHLDASVEIRQIKIEVAPIVPPVVKQQGSAPLSAAVNNSGPDAYLNLDNGVRGDAAGGDLSGMDVRFVLSGGSQVFYVLQPANGAAAKFMGATEPGYLGCKQAEGSFSTGNIPEIVLGNYICFRTNKNRYAQVRIEAVEPIISGVGNIRLGFITWEPQ